MSGVQKSILFRGKNLVMWKSILFRKKKFRSSSSKKHFVSQAKKIYGTGAVERKKASCKKSIVNYASPGAIYIGTYELVMTYQKNLQYVKNRGTI